MNNFIRTLIVIYILIFTILCVFVTPYKEYQYIKTDYEFTGVRGYASFFTFDEIEHSKDIGMFAYYIDFQFLFIEILVLTVFSLGVFLVFKK